MDSEALLFIVFLGFLSFSSCEDQIVNAKEYTELMNNFIVQGHGSDYWFNEFIIIRDYLAYLSPDLEITPSIIKAHQALILILDASKGDLCGDEGAKLIKFMKPVIKYSKELSLKEKSRFHHLYSFVLDQHASKCRQANLNILQEWKNNLGDDEKKLSSLLDLKIQYYCTSGLEMETDVLFDFVTQQDPGVISELKKCTSTECRLKKAIENYEEYIRQPCGVLEEAVGDIIFFVDREFERDQLSVIERYFRYNSDEIIRQLYQFSIKFHLCHLIRTDSAIVPLDRFLSKVSQLTHSQVMYETGLKPRPSRKEKALLKLQPEWLNEALRKTRSSERKSWTIDFPCILSFEDSD